MSKQPLMKRPENSDDGVIRGLSLRIKLILRLMRDSRVNLFLKLLPIGALLYLIIPDLIFGPLDDAIVLWIGTTLFVELCPQDVVREHRDALNSVIEGEWREIQDDE
ncbi:MAG: hypothetical protein GTO14_23520 [Anaerolineales bacterium]|nr:hypothetical protein [Anaerolineales bacterium]